MGGADATRAGAEPGARKPGKAWSGKCELGVQGNLTWTASGPGQEHLGGLGRESLGAAD